MNPDFRHQARSLQLRVNRLESTDVVAMAHEARRLFSSSGDRTRARWLELELGGYGERASIQPLHEVLAVPRGDRLAVHVAAYRAQRGRSVDVERRTVDFKHFFVESLPELVLARNTVASQGVTGELRLDFSGDGGGHPATGLFGADVFHRVLSGFVAALHLQLGAIAR